MTPSTHRSRVSAQTFRRVLALCDIAAITLAWMMVLLGLAIGEPDVHRLTALGAWLVVAVGSTAVVLSRSQLYLSRVVAIRAVEAQRLGRSCLISAVLLAVVDRMLGAMLGPVLVGLGSLTVYGMLLTVRGAVHAWLHDDQRHERDGRCLLVVGDVGEAHHAVAILRERPDLGYRVVGFVAPRRPPTPLDVPWLGTPDDLALLTQLTAVDSVVIGSTLAPATMSAVVGNLWMLDVHVHVVVEDTAGSNIRIVPLAHRTTLTVGQPALSAWQQIAKRGFDIVAGGALAVAAAPVLVAASCLLKLTAGGPVFVRDTRVGPNGDPLTVVRLRTTAVGSNRVAAWVARTCRRLSIDELPQLHNVLAGSMSLVGPRPQRPERAVATGGVPAGMHPGLIGLRHVELRDYPEHVRHRRLDHFYAQNWSLSLDMSIVAASATHVLWRTTDDGVRSDEHAVVG